MKIAIVAILLIILFSMGSALFRLVRDKGTTDRTVKALSWRIGLSVGLFVLLFVGFAMGYIAPHGI